MAIDSETPNALEVAHAYDGAARRYDGWDWQTFWDLIK